MTVIEELLALFEEVYEQGSDSAVRDTLSGEEARGGMTCAEASQKAVEKLRKELRANISFGSEHQFTDPRTHYVDVEINKTFYAWLWGEKTY